MPSPLVSRPPYGEGKPRMPTAESGLPKGTPGGKGVSLDEGTAGTSTFVKPLDDDGSTETKEDSIYRVDSPREMGKNRDRIDVTDQTDSQPSYMGLGKPQNSPKTKYPYRDDHSNTHNASVEFVAGVWQLQTAPEMRVLTPVRVAATTSEMLTGLNPKFVEKAQSCSVNLKRADIPNLRWIFAVNCGNGAKVVRVKAARKGSIVQFDKLDLHVACSCPAWRWQGPEFHSTTKDFQDPKTQLQGTASAPDIRDPERQNFVCKHVAAVLSFTKNWVIPPKKG